MNSDRFDEPYEYMNHMENTHEDTYLIDAQEQDMKKNDAEQDKFYEDTNDELITEE